MPAVESLVKGDDLMKHVDVPGLDSKDAQISILHDVLAIKGERKADGEVKEKDHLLREVSFGCFEMRISRARGAAADRITVIL